MHLLLQDYQDIVNRFNRVFKNLKSVSKEEAMQLYADMVAFIQEDHPIREIRNIYSVGMMESLGMLLDDSGPISIEFMTQQNNLEKKT